MTEDDVAAAIAYAISNGGWKATAYFNEIEFTNEDGEKFIIIVEKKED